MKSAEDDVKHECLETGTYVTHTNPFLGIRLGIVSVCLHDCVKVQFLSQGGGWPSSFLFLEAVKVADGSEIEEYLRKYEEEEALTALAGLGEP